MIDSVARGSEFETGDSSLKEYSNVSPKAPQTKEEKKVALKEQKMFNALYKLMLQEKDDAKPLHYEAGNSMGAYLIKECKEEYLNLIVIDTGIL
jgi:predicted hydrocarbon binding protein